MLRRDVRDDWLVLGRGEGCELSFFKRASKYVAALELSEGTLRGDLRFVCIAVRKLLKRRSHLFGSSFG